MTHARPSPPRRALSAAALVALLVGALLVACCPVPASPGVAADRSDAAWLVRVTDQREGATRVETVGRGGPAGSSGSRRVWVRPPLELPPGREVYLRGSFADDGTFRWVSASPLPAADAP